MNKQIKELALQAGPNTMDELNADRINVYVIDVKKFSEMLIKETLQVARAGMEYGPSMDEVVYKYFGIKS